MTRQNFGFEVDEDVEADDFTSIFKQSAFCLFDTFHTSSIRECSPTPHQIIVLTSIMSEHEDLIAQFVGVTGASPNTV